MAKAGRALKKELFNLRLNHATGQLNNPLAFVRLQKATSRELRPRLQRESCPKGFKGDATNGKNKQKTRIGTVVSDKMDKTIVVAVVEKVQTSVVARKNGQQDQNSRLTTSRTNAESATPC